ncbi:MAG: hypothetical protein K0S01_552 [Herbinix sp.]|jgi:hypothetical protein|nr:hypothetical protein [Herbinix sp.]
MKKKGSFFGGLVVFFLIIIILGGVGYLGYNIIKNGNGGMASMTSDSTSGDTNNTDVSNTDTPTDTANSNNDTSTNNDTTTASENSNKITQINQVMLNKEILDKASNTINSSLEQMTLDPYAAKSDTNATTDMQGMNDSQQNNPDTIAQGSTTVNIYTAPTDQMTQTQSMSMGQTYDSDKMQQLHSGLFKVSVGMQLLSQLQNNLEKQIEQASIDANSDSEYFMNQYYSTIQNKNKLTNALTYINEAVDLININPYVDANGVVYDSSKMTQLHDSIYMIAQGVVDLNKLNDDLLTQAVHIGNSAQNSYNQELVDSVNTNNNTMDMSTGGLFSNLNLSSIITFAMIAFVVIFIIGLLGAILNLFKSNKTGNEQIS